MPVSGRIQHIGNRTISCTKCDFQRQVAKTGKSADKWQKITLRLHNKVCPGTGKTEDKPYIAPLLKSGERSGALAKKRSDDLKKDFGLFGGGEAITITEKAKRVGKGGKGGIYK